MSVLIFPIRPLGDPRLPLYDFEHLSLSFPFHVSPWFMEAPPRATWLPREFPNIVYCNPMEACLHNLRLYCQHQSFGSRSKPMWMCTARCLQQMSTAVPPPFPTGVPLRTAIRNSFHCGRAPEAARYLYLWFNLQALPHSPLFPGDSCICSNILLIGYGAFWFLLLLCLTVHHWMFAVIAPVPLLVLLGLCF